MALTGPLNGVSRIAVDTPFFIYLVERNPLFFDKVEPVFAAIDAGDVQAVASVLALSKFSYDRLKWAPRHSPTTFGQR